MSVETDTLIVGAGPAGLAVGAALRRENAPFVILERADALGAAWRRHYDRLHLHTPKGHSALPFVPYPRHYPRYPSREQFIAYLEDYARRFDLEPLYGQEVVSCRRAQDGAWEVATASDLHRARRLVVATGFNRFPRRPSWPGQESFPGPLLHSADYVTGETFRGQRILVVGFGNSGAEIALDLYEHGAETAVSLRGPANVVPRDVLGIPATAFALMSRRLPPRLADLVNAPTIRLSIGNLARHGVPKRPDGPFTEILKHQHVPVVDVGTVRLIKRGAVAVRPGLRAFDGPDVLFADGRREPFDAVVLATGFETGLASLFQEDSSVVDPSGHPLTATGGIEAATGPDLYFCGFRLVPTGFLREIALEAQRIAHDIARKRTTEPVTA